MIDPKMMMMDPKMIMIDPKIKTIDPNIIMIDTKMKMIDCPFKYFQLCGSLCSSQQDTYIHPTITNKQNNIRGTNSKNKNRSLLYTLAALCKAVLPSSSLSFALLPSD